MGNNIIGTGNAVAAGQVGSANALNGGISQGISLYQQNQLLNRVYPQGGGGPLPSPVYNGTPTTPLPYGSSGAIMDWYA